VLTSIGSWNHAIPQTQGIERGPYPDMFRGRHSDRIDAGHYYAQEVKDVIDFNTSGKVALFMAEPIQGAGGIVP
jgi:alanine-glyoxylate transaminase/(R)-3-amino-2-methylpropionate-pyruvate transaminase